MPLQVFPNVAVSFGNTSSPLGTENVTTSTATATVTLSPPGFWMVLTGSQNLVQYTPNAGGTYRTLLAASSSGIIWSDGQNFRIYNTSTGGQTSYYTQILGLT